MAKKSDAAAGRRRNRIRLIRSMTAGQLACLSLSLFVLLIALGGVSAFADEEGSSSASLPTSQELLQAIEANGSQPVPAALTDPTAAEGVPHRELGRDEAVELLQGVFEPELVESAGIFSNLEVEKFLSPHVAVIAGDNPSTAASEPGSGEASSPAPEEDPQAGQGEEEASPPSSEEEADSENANAAPNPIAAPPQISGDTLLDSTVPLRTEGSSDDEGTVNLDLEHSEGELQPVNPLVEVGVPQQLGEGIELPGPGVSIELAAAPQERSPSTVNDSVAVYPNVAQDTDFAVAPTPTGVETLTQIRSAEAPRSQTLNLDLPSGASLAATGEGGAAVKRDEKLLIGIAPPTAIDANGRSVPVSLKVSGASLELTVSPEDSTAFPILLDPLFQTYAWSSSSWAQSGICNSSIEFISSNQCTNREEWGYQQYLHGSHIEVNNHVGEKTGLYIQSGSTLTAGDYANIIYTVPRFFTDPSLPTSYVGHMTLSDLTWAAMSSHPSPLLVMGLWDSAQSTLVAPYVHEGAMEHSLTDQNYQYQFSGESPTTHEPNTNVKTAVVGIQASETQPNGNTSVFVGAATVELGDKDAPQQPVVPTAPSAWVNQTAPPLVFSATDTGLGVFAVTASTEQLGTNGQPLHSWKASYGCKGVGDAACPRTWQSPGAGHPSLTYEPALLPTGVSYLNVVAEDPVGNKSKSAAAQVRVDHTAPAVTLTGAMTEQVKLGTKRPTYLLKIATTDGTTAAPQSGVAKTVIKVDGKVVDESAPGCTTENCSISREWTLESSQYAAGTHIVEVTATDAVGLSTTKTLTIELHLSPPSVALSGTMTEQATLGLTRPRYTLKLNAAAEAGAETPVAYLSSVGSAGFGNGQLSHPADVAVDSQGNLWTVDRNNDRIEEFNEKGEYVKKFGTPGEGNGQLNWPTALAIDAKGNVWVTDTENYRVEEFNEKGEYVAQFGGLGATNGKFVQPEGIAIDSKGNIWVTDIFNGRVQEFTEKGVFIKLVGSKGSGAGQFSEPTGIAIGPANNVWIADWSNNRVEEYNEAGTYVRQFGAEGTGSGQFKHPDGIEVDAKGNVWVTDTENSRVQEFNEKGEYAAQFGAKGTGAGQMTLSRGSGLAADSHGNIWVTDTNNNRLQKWQTPSYIPTYSSFFGSTGTGNGQFIRPNDVAIDAKGNAWVTDASNARVQKFNEKGEYVSKFGSLGAGLGQLNQPDALAIDPKGNVWVTDANNNRIEEFNEAGTFVKAVGTKGTANGQFEHPEGIAIDSKGNIWVADKGNGRLEEFSETGTFVKVVASKGTGAGQLGEPLGIAIGPANNVWVADSSNNRVEEFNEAGTYVRQFGSEGSGNGQLSHPAAVNVDNRGNVWVADSTNNRIEEFNEKGEYVAQFGTKGTGVGQFTFSRPMGIATDSKGDFWVTNANNNQVQKWTPTTSASEVSTETTVDGKAVDSGIAHCGGEHCPLTREWNLESSAYSVGKHTVLAKATDGLGNTTTKTLTIEIQRDTTKPTLEASGSLFEAPQGWVEQQSYSLTGKATDGGSGVTQMKLMIDGAQAGIATQTCVNGGCTLSNTFTVNTASYPGGAHEAELIATDGAGNATTKKWTINVDPEGHVSIAEVIDTVEAAEATGSTEVVQGGEEEQVTLTANGEALSAVGGMLPTVINKDPANGVGMEILEGNAFAGCEGESFKPCEPPPAAETPGLVPLKVVPTASGSGATEMTQGPEGGTAVSANTSAQADTVVRPTYDGDLTFAVIRDTSAPESYSWTIQLGGGATMKLESPQYVQVYYASGHTAFGIAAEPAHDAVGAAVPTKLSVSEGNVLTMTVEHRSASFVYPILAGTGWEGGFFINPVVGPKDEKEIKEEEERVAKEKQEELEREWAEEEAGGPVGGLAHYFGNGQWGIDEVGPTVVGAPEIDAAASTSGAQISGVWVPARSIISRPFRAPACYIFPAEEPPQPIHPHTHGQCNLTGNTAARGWVHGHFHYEIPKGKVWWNNGREGEIDCGVDHHYPAWKFSPKECNFSGENQQTTHIVARNRWRAEAYFPLDGNVVICIQDHVDLFPNGFVSENLPDYQHNPIMFPGEGQPCPWSP